MDHPLAYSDPFSKANLLDAMGQYIQAASVPFAISQILGQNLICIDPVVTPLFLPSALVVALAGDNEPRLRKVMWLSPVIGISLLTLAGRAAFDLMSNSFLKGLVYGVHSCAIGILTNVPGANWLGIISLRDVLGKYIGVPAALEQLSPNGRAVAEKRSEILSSLVFVTASLGLSVFGGIHVITANVIGHVAAAVTKVVLVRLFANIAERQPAPAAAVEHQPALAEEENNNELAAV